MSRRAYREWQDDCANDDMAAQSAQMRPVGFYGDEPPYENVYENGRLVGRNYGGWW